LLAYITYFIVTVVIRPVQRAGYWQASCAAMRPAAGKLYKMYNKIQLFIVFICSETQYEFISSSPELLQMEVIL